MKAKNKYYIPVKKEDVEQIKYDSPAHTGKLKYSVDYLLPEGREIYASQDGEVVFVQDDSNVGGPNKKYWNKGNYLTIKHPNGEYSLYEHFKYKGAKVKVGDKVKKGQLIAYSGNTGYTFAPHLHFQVFRFTGPNKDEDFETLKINFNEENLKGKNLEKKLHLLLGIAFLVSSFILLPLSATGFFILNNSIKLNFLPAVLFLGAIAEIYLYTK